MAAELAAIQTHLWVLTFILVFILLANIACNYWRAREDSIYRRMKHFLATENHTELIVLASKCLKKSPADSLALMYKAIALLALDRLDDAKEVALKFKAVSPNMRSDAIELLESIDERIAGED